MLMNTNPASVAQSESTLFASARIFVAVSVVAAFASISAIASVKSSPPTSADEEITQQILIIEDQEISSRSAQHLEEMAAPRTALSWQRTAFPTVSNPVLLADDQKIDETNNGPAHLRLVSLAMIEDAVSFAEIPDVPEFAPVAASAPKKRGQAQWYCLAEAIYFEARSEAAIAQRAVAEVVMNRVDSRRYPDSVCEVVNQGSHKRHRCQFSYNCDGRPETIHNARAWSRAKDIAKDMVIAELRPLTRGATHYHTTAVRPFWSNSLERTAKYGAHIFYKRGTRLSRR